MLNHPLAKWNKTLLAVLGMLVNLVYAYNVTNPNAWLQAVLAVATAAGVYQVKNKTV